MGFAWSSFSAYGRRQKTNLVIGRRLCTTGISCYLVISLR